MKLTFLILLGCLMQVSATVYSQATKFSFNIEDKQVVEVLKEIQDQSDFRFFYQREQVDVTRKVDLKVSDTSVEAILDELFKGQDITYNVLENNLIVIAPKTENFTSIASQQQKKISGKVTDSSRATLPGVSVVVKGTTTGVITDFNGNYSLSNIPENAILQFSFVGMKAQEVKVGNQATVNVVLVEETVALDEVVAIGYGTQKKGNLTGSVSQIKSDALQERAITGLGEAFAGQIAGVRHNRFPDDQERRLTIQMRGISSVTSSNKPLYVIDGTPIGDMQDFNPNDVASIEVLKDASSAAIYGARGSGGVVLISTKKGGGKPLFSFESYYGIQEVDKLLPMMNRDQFIAFSKYQKDLLYIRSGGQYE